MDLIHGGSGFDGEGRLGLGTNQNHSTPQLLECPNKSGWKKFVCAFIHSFGMTNDDQLYV